MSLSQKIRPLSEALEIIACWKTQNETLVFTNGCFDILHSGHVLYLEEAKQLGTKLIVAVNTDQGIRRLKGKLRPVKPQEDRYLCLAAHQSVDLIIPFEEDTPLHIIEAVLPSILVKGGDYTIADIVGHDAVISHGGNVTTIPLVSGKSTSVILEEWQSKQA